MSVAAAQAAAFYAEVAESDLVFTIRDEEGFPAPMTPSGVRSQPFWSKRSRAECIIKNVAAYQGMHVVEVARDDWLNKWLPGLESDGMLVGINWSGQAATGYDLSPSDAVRNVSALTQG
ncbi:DUF2750 domain-containing protein [Nocardioides sp. NPDC047086]|uniref:DUF2750 domain-containing protein n=1 Tax=Nocardioides sp. NPDC047086 TaxID=3154810 RepID=UPI0033DDCEE5